MNRGELVTLARAYIKSDIHEQVLLTILKEGALDVASRLLLTKTTGTFTVTANTSEYAISSVLTRYLTMDEPGLWWNDGNQWRELDPVTVKWLDNKMPNWRDSEAGDPQRYAIYGDNIIIHPKPDTTLASGFKAYFIQKPAVMTLDAHFPFAINDPPTTEWSPFAIVSSTILLFWEWKALKILERLALAGEKAAFAQLAFSKYKEYLAEIEVKREVLSKAMDISSNRNTKMMGLRTNAIQ